MYIKRWRWNRNETVDSYREDIIPEYPFEETYLAFTSIQNDLKYTNTDRLIVTANDLRIVLQAYKAMEQQLSHLAVEQMYASVPDAPPAYIPRHKIPKIKGFKL